MAADDGVLKQLRGVLDHYPRMAFCVLFGSHARGTQGPQSDIDLLVDGDVDTEDLASKVSASLKREVDVLRVPDLTFPLLEEVVQDGLLVRANDRVAYGAFWARALLELETDRPLFERMRKGWLRRVAQGGAIG